MREDRRDFLRRSGRAAVVAGAAGLLGAKTATAAEETPMVAACGIACNTCPLMKAGKCKGCAPGNAASAEMVKMKNCPVLSCANMKKIAYCGTGCMKFAECGKLVGRPYDKAFLDKIKTKLA